MSSRYERVDMKYPVITRDEDNIPTRCLNRSCASIERQERLKRIFPSKYVCSSIEPRNDRQVQRGVINSLAGHIEIKKETILANQSQHTTTFKLRHTFRSSCKRRNRYASKILVEGHSNRRAGARARKLGALDWRLNTDWPIRPILYRGLLRRRSRLSPSQISNRRSSKADVLECVNLWQLSVSRSDEQPGISNIHRHLDRNYSLATSHTAESRSASRQRVYSTLALAPQALQDMALLRARLHKREKRRAWLQITF